MTNDVDHTVAGNGERVERPADPGSSRAAFEVTARFVIVADDEKHARALLEWALLLGVPPHRAIPRVQDNPHEVVDSWEIEVPNNEDYECWECGAKGKDAAHEEGCGRK